MKAAILGPIVKDTVTIDGSTHQHVGGIPYYTGVAMKNLGVHVTVYATYHKKDDEWIRPELEGVILKHVDASGTLNGHLTYSDKEPDMRTVTIDYHLNPIDKHPALVEELKQFDYIILSPLFHDNIQPDFFKMVKEELRKPLVHGNFGLFTHAVDGKMVKKHPEKFMEAAPYIDYLFLDEPEILFATSSKTLIEAVEKLQKFGMKEIIVTRGSKGSSIFTAYMTYDIPAYPPRRVMDPTGAGDTYLAAYIAALDWYDDPLMRGKFAAMTATISLEDKGAFAGSVDEVKKRLKDAGEDF